MLRKLTVENFYSIAEAQTLDLGIAKNVPDSDGRYATPIDGMSDRFPKVVTLFGANASGKTNVLRSIVFLVDFIRNSANWGPNDVIPFLAFQSPNWLGRPTKFKVEIDALFIEEQTSRNIYVYELEISPSGKDVLRESLKYYPVGRPRLLFDRSGGNIKAGKEFQISKRDPVRGTIRNNASVISTLAKFNHSFSLAIFNALNAVQTNVMMIGDKIELTEHIATKYYIDNKEIFDALNKEIRRFDLGILEIKLETTPDGVKPKFVHAGLQGSMNIDFESQGTRKFYSLFPYLNFVRKTGGIAVLDEFDNDIHPLILPELIASFQSSKTNPNNAQLIISCHNPSILGTLEKEEVYFTEKDATGRTGIYGLSDVKSVSRETNLFAKYLAGAFGGTPRVG